MNNQPLNEQFWGMIFVLILGTKLGMLRTNPDSVLRSFLPVLWALATISPLVPTISPLACKASAYRLYYVSMKVDF